MVGVYKDKTCKDYNKAYYELNKEHIREHNKNYYHLNKERLLKKMKCMNCGGSYSICSVNSHFQTKKHLKAIRNSIWDEVKRIELGNIDFLDEWFNLSGNIN